MTDGEARVSTVVLGDDGSVTRLYEFGPGGRRRPTSGRCWTSSGARPAGPGEWAVVTGAAPPGVSPGFYAALVARRPRRRLPHAGRRDRRAARRRARRAPRPRQGEPGGGVLRRRRARRCTATTRRRRRRTQLVAEGLELCRRLVAAGAAGAVLTLGAAGAWRRPGRRRVARRARGRCKAVNPVGSGDCFAAGLMLALQRGDGAAAALRLAAGRRRRQRRLAVQRRRRPGAGGGAGGRRLRRPARLDPRASRGPSGGRPARERLH